jgi:predicted DNA-binding transcriptional regulator AlpA
MNLTNNKHGGSPNPHVATTKRIAYSMAEVAAMTGRNRSTIWRWMNRGLLQRVRVPGGRPLITAASVEKLLRGEAPK